MKVVVLAGGTSTERDVSLISGSMIYKALKKNGHQAILLDVYLGYEGDTDGIFERELDWTSRIGAIAEKNPDLEAVKALRPDGEKNFSDPMYSLYVRGQMRYSWHFTVQTERMARFRHALS